MNDTSTCASPPPGAAAGPTPGAAERRYADFFESTHRRLLAYAARRVDITADAADVVAETYLIAWRRIDDVPEGDAAIGWLFGTARRVLSNQRRGELRRHALADRLRADLETAPEAPPEPDHSPVLTALAQMRPEDQEILRLDAWDGATPEQIAAVLGITAGAARVRLHRARRRLAAALTASGPHAAADTHKDVS